MPTKRSDHDRAIRLPGRSSACPLDNKRENEMNRIIFLLLALSLSRPGFTDAYDTADVERDSEAMKAIVEDFCQVKMLCKNKEHGKFTVYRYNGEETDKILSPDEKKRIDPCKEKYEVRMTIKDTESVHIYCYDGAKPRLIVEKTVAGEKK